MTTPQPFRPLVTLKLSIQAALLGEVTCRLVSVTCGFRGNIVIVRAYMSDEITADDREWISEIGGEVIADFPEGYMIEESCLSIEETQEQMLDFWAFRRAEREVETKRNRRA